MKVSELYYERYFGVETPLKAMPAIGYSSQRKARRGLAEHMHEVYEICLIRKGQVRWQLEGAQHEVNAGELFFTKPGQIHGSVYDVFEPSDLVWLQVDQRELSDAMAKKLAAITQTIFCDDGQFMKLHDQLLCETREARADAPLMCEAMVNQLVLILARLSQRQPSGEDWPEHFIHVKKAIDASPGHFWTLDEMCDLTGVGSSRLQMLFQQAVGQSPIAYALRQRLHLAYELLRETQLPILEIALDLNFSSSQHFSSAFKKQYGMSPRQCRLMEGL